MAINLQPTNGETPLTTAPTWSGTGGGTAAQQVYAFQEFSNLFGRNPTQSELDELAPSYSSGDANKANTSAGNAAVASYYNAVANSPTNLTAQQNAQGLAAYQAGQSGYDATTNAAFQTATGQAATSDELSHFGSLLATGQIDAYGLSQLVGQTQQAQQYSANQEQSTLSNQLQGTQANYFQNYIEPSILSQTAAAGRDPNSSGVQQAGVQAGQQQNYQLQNYLAQFGASQYGQTAANTQGVYNQYLNQQYGLTNAGLSQQLGEQSYMQQQNTNLANQQYQQNAYQNYLNNYGNKNNSLLSKVGLVQSIGSGGIEGGSALYNGFSNLSGSGSSSSGNQGAGLISSFI